VGPVRERRDADARDEGAHLPRQAEALGSAAHQEAPPHGGDQDQPRAARPAIERAMVSTPGSARLGCTAMKRMAQMSWTTSTPRVRRPDRTFSSNFSRSSLTTMSVELSEMTIARRRGAKRRVVAGG